MALIPTELFGPEVARPQSLRAFPAHDGIRPGSLAAQGSAAALPNLSPLYFDVAAATWKVWVGDVSEITTLTAHASTPATAGTFTLTVNGVTSAAIAFDATAAIVQTALEAMSNIAPGDVTAVATTGANLGVASAVVTLNWAGTLAGTVVTITADQTLISAGSDFVLAEATAGGTDPGAGGNISAFLWCPDDPVIPSTTGETMVQIFRAGSIHPADIPVPTGTSRTDLNEALRLSSPSLRENNIEIAYGLSGIH